MKKTMHFQRKHISVLRTLVQKSWSNYWWRFIKSVSFGNLSCGVVRRQSFLIFSRTERDISMQRSYSQTRYQIPAISDLRTKMTSWIKKNTSYSRSYYPLLMVCYSTINQIVWKFSGMSIHWRLFSAFIISSSQYKCTRTLSMLALTSSRKHPISISKWL